MTSTVRTPLVVALAMLGLLGSADRRLVKCLR